MKPRVSLFLLAVTLPLVALAHGNDAHIRGVLKSKDRSALVVTTSTGESRVEVGANTRFEADGNPATADDAHIGQRVVIHASKHDGALRATRVQLGAMETDAPKVSKP